MGAVGICVQQLSGPTAPISCCQTAELQWFGVSPAEEAVKSQDIPLFLYQSITCSSSSTILQLAFIVKSLSIKSPSFVRGKAD